MKTRIVLSALVLLHLSSVMAAAADLSRIDRHIAKHPAYKSKTVKYALLVFGSDANHRVWLALDGDTLYVDRNGNGDLTDVGEKIAPEKDERRDDGEYTFKVDELKVGGHVHKDLYVMVGKLSRLVDRGSAVRDIVKKTQDARSYYVMCEVDMPPWKGTGVGGRVQQRAFYLDAAGVLQFADRPEEAPIIHFAGLWQISLFGPHSLTAGRQRDLVLGVGTPGVGPGTMAWVDYEGVIPPQVYPVADITFPPGKPGDPSPRERYELKQRC
jgi:hypothetical protein